MNAAPPSLSLGEIADHLGIELHGSRERRVRALAPIDSAEADDLAFVVDVTWRERLRASRAGAVIVPVALADEVSGDRLVAHDPYAAYAEASWLFAPEHVSAGGIEPGAIVDPEARIAPSARIETTAVVRAGAVIGEQVLVGAGSVIGHGSRIGARTRLFPRVIVADGVSIGADCRVQSGAVLGSEGFGYARTASGWRAIRQSGGVTIGERVHIGANTTIDRGALEATVIADGVILDNQIQIAHNVRIGENTAIAGCTGVAGSTIIGRDCLIGGACNIVGHIEIADRVVLNAASLVTRSITEAGRYGSGGPLLPERLWRRTFAQLGRLDDLVRRVRRLERGRPGQE